ncbi:MAG: extracellular solute-binding protein, partial [Selenomonadaceae bacterium]|nr:extracellular solute-binding protein [Selenomonadaceae bacterium]
LAEQFVAGEEPDVFFVLAEDFNLYASIGALMNLENLIADDKNFSTDVYYPGAFNFGKFENISYALPCESKLTYMFVNKTLLAKENIALPKNDWTWKDFLEICRSVTRDTDGDGVPDQFGCFDYSWQQAAISNGVKLFRDDGKTSYFADARMEEAIKFLMELRGLNGGFEVSPKDFDVGRVAFRPFTFAQYRTYKPYPWKIKKYSSFEWDCVKMPAGSSGGNVSVMDTLLVGISSRTRNKNLAWTLLKRICYDKNIQQLILKKSQALPVRRDVIISSEAQEIFSWDSKENAAITAADISEAMNESIMPFKFKNYNSAILYADTEIKKIISGVVPLNNALNKLQKEINAQLQY